mgnify:CR=1 FL=1
MIELDALLKKCKVPKSTIYFELLSVINDMDSTECFVENGKVYLTDRGITKLQSHFPKELGNNSAIPLSSTSSIELKTRKILGKEYVQLPHIYTSLGLSNITLQRIINKHKNMFTIYRGIDDTRTDIQYIYVNDVPKLYECASDQVKYKLLPLLNVTFVNDPTIEIVDIKTIDNVCFEVYKHDNKYYVLLTQLLIYLNITRYKFMLYLDNINDSTYTTDAFSNFDRIYVNLSCLYNFVSDINTFDQLDTDKLYKLYDEFKIYVNVQNPLTTISSKSKFDRDDIRKILEPLIDVCADVIYNLLNIWNQSYRK